MKRSEITAAVVIDIDRLLAEGLDHAAIAARLGVTEYVVGVIAGDKIGKGRRPPPGRSDRRVMNSSRGIDAVTLRRIQRMLQVGWFNHEQIAREAGVSGNLVSEVALGRRPISTLRSMEVDEGELFVPEPIRCGLCGALVSVVPCRACRTRLVGMIDTWFKKYSQKPYHAWKFFDALSRRLGGRAMQALMTTLSTELTTILDAKEKREQLIASAEKLFDQVIEPLDVPSPDRSTDPVFRAVVRPLVGRLYDESVKRLERSANAA